MRGRGGGSRGGGRGGKSGKGGKSRDFGPPDRVVEIGVFLHNAESEMVCKSTAEKIPYFNAPIYLENKQKVGKIEEVLGPINEVFFTIKPDDGIESASFEKESKFYIDPTKLLDPQRFLDQEKPKPKGTGGKGGKGGKGGRGGKGGKGKGGSRGGKGGSRGGGKGKGRGGR